MGGVKLLATLFGYCQLMPAGRPKSRVELQTAPTLWLSIAVGLGKMWQSGKLKGECWKTWGQGWENLRGKEKAKAGDEATDEQQEHALRSTCVQVADVDVDVTDSDTRHRTQDSGLRT